MGIPIYIRPQGAFAFSAAKYSITWEQNKSHYRILFNDEFEYEDAAQQLTSWFESSLFDPDAHPDSDKILEDLTPETCKELLPDDSISPNQEVDGLLRSNSNSSLFDDNCNTPDLLDARSPIFSLVSSPRDSDVEFLASPSPTRNRDPFKNTFDGENIFGDDKEDPGSDDAKNPRFTEDEVQLEFGVPQPYRRAIQTLRRITSLRSPRDKLGCILHTFMDVIQCVTDFWDAHERDPVVSADDLVPIFSYVILKARVPKLFSEMKFIWEFASDSEMRGKYGYSYATFEIGIQVIINLTQEEERKANAELQKQVAEQKTAEALDTTSGVPEEHHAMQDIKSKHDLNLSNKRHEVERRLTPTGSDANTGDGQSKKEEESS